MVRSGARDDRVSWSSEERRRRLDEAFRAHAPRILNYARYRGATLVEAEDVVSEVFVVLTRRLEDAPEEMLPWLFGVARKVLYNQMRGKRRKAALSLRMEQEALRAEAAGVESSYGDAADPLVGKALSRLSERDREAILLVAWDELSYEEAARSLGCTPAAYAQTLRRARQRMSEIVDELRACEAPDLVMGE